MITLPRTLHISKSEEIMKNIQNTNQEEELEIPIDSKNFAFGGLSTAIQCVNTWARKMESRELLIRESVNEYQSKVVSFPYKFVSAMMSKKIHTFDMKEKVVKEDIRNSINIAAKDAIESQGIKKYGQNRGSLCWFAFVDHSTKGFDPNFYIKKMNTEYTLRNNEQISSVIQSMILKSISITNFKYNMQHEESIYIGKIFYELFLNTHEHGTKDKNRNNWLKPGVRIVYTNGLNFKEEATANTVKDEKALITYMNGLPEIVANENGNKIRRFVEIGIVDSGLGYVQRWLCDSFSNENIENLSLKKEYSIFKKCFEFRATSTDSDYKGKGLPSVMDRLTKLSGFIRIRSGRLSLYRDFKRDPYIDNDQCEFYDWNTEQSSEKFITEMPISAGVSITLLLPLKENK